MHGQQTVHFQYQTGQRRSVRIHRIQYATAKMGVIVNQSGHQCSSVLLRSKVRQRTAVQHRFGGRLFAEEKVTITHVIESSIEERGGKQKFQVNQITSTMHL